MSYFDDAGGITVDLLNGQGNGASAFGDTYNSIENAVGGEGDDTFIGKAGANVFDGGDGVDTVDYSGILEATKGFKLTLVEDGNAGIAITAIGVASDAVGDKVSNVENIIGGAGNDTITGNTKANQLDGGGGNDTLDGKANGDELDGGAGNDTLTGGLGEDSLNGGAGNDIFRFAFELGTTDADSDVINDFVLAADKIGISKAGFGLPAGLTQAQFEADYLVITGDPGATAAHAQFLYSVNNGALSFDADGNTDDGVAPILLATLEGDLGLVFGNFQLLV